MRHTEQHCYSPELLKRLKPEMDKAVDQNIGDLMWKKKNKTKQKKKEKTARFPISQSLSEDSLKAVSYRTILLWKKNL